MKIVIWSTPIYKAPPSGYAGLELITGLMAQELDKRGIETILIAPEGSYEPKNGKLLSTGKEMEISEQQVYEKHKDEVKELCNDETVIWDNTWANFAYLLKTKDENIKVCSTFHGMTPHRSVPFKKMNLICASQAQGMVFRQSLGIETKTVYHGIDLEAYKYSEEKEDYFLFLSRIFPPKGAHLAIWLCDKLKKKLKVVGGSFGDNQNYVNYIKSQCKESEYCEFLGEVDFPTKVDLYSKAKATLVPLIPFAVYGGTDVSTWVEIFGLFMPESFASGTPVITTYCGATPEIVTNRSYGFVCAGVEDLEYAIENVDQVEPRHCLKRSKYFSKERMCDDYIHLFQEILEGKEW